MRILNQTDDKSIDEVLLLLTVDEAKEIRDKLERLLMQKNGNDHSHINDINNSKEITISLYRQDETSGFTERIQRLILDDR